MYTQGLQSVRPVESNWCVVTWMELPNISHTLSFGFRLRLDFLEACFSGPAYEVWGRWREMLMWPITWLFGLLVVRLMRDYHVTTVRLSKFL
jgi:hypothetical protein